MALTALTALTETVDAARSVLLAAHAPARYNQYGACEAAGYRVDEGRDGMARVSHVVPNVDLMDANRPSDDKLAAERQQMVGLYGETLSAAGWAVTSRGPRSRKPCLLALREVSVEPADRPARGTTMTVEAQTIRLQITQDDKPFTEVDVQVYPWHIGNYGGDWDLWLRNVAPEWVDRTASGVDGGAFRAVAADVAEGRQLADNAFTHTTEQ